MRGIHGRLSDVDTLCFSHGENLLVRIGKLEMKIPDNVWNAFEERENEETEQSYQFVFCVHENRY